MADCHRLLIGLKAHRGHCEGGRKDTKNPDFLADRSREVAGRAPEATEPARSGQSISWPEVTRNDQNAKKDGATWDENEFNTQQKASPGLSFFELSAELHWLAGSLTMFLITKHPAQM
jgi:hypothetical protein